jgi:secreted trypsin-like serine protease
VGELSKTRHLVINLLRGKKVKIIFCLTLLVCYGNSYSEDIQELKLHAIGEQLSQTTIELQLNSLPKLSESFEGSIPARLALAELNSKNSGLQNQFRNYQRIVGGETTQEGEYSWQVALFIANYPPAAGFFCGGSIIGDKWILTAAHCVEDMPSGLLNVFVGSRDLNSKKGKKFKTKKIHIHPKWDSLTMQADIALVELEQADGWLTSHKINLTKNENTAQSGLLEVTGWGALIEGGVGSTLLKKVFVPFIHDEVCKSKAFLGNAIKDGMICAGIEGKDSCKGDSGGALVKKNSEDNYLQVGIVSWGRGCAKANKPGVYTDVQYFISWIDGILS